MKEKTRKEEYDYVAGHCKLNYLNVRTVIMAKGVKIKRWQSQQMNHWTRGDRVEKGMLECMMRFWETLWHAHRPENSPSSRSRRAFATSSFEMQGFPSNCDRKVWGHELWLHMSFRLLLFALTLNQTFNLLAQTADSMFGLQQHRGKNDMLKHWD